MKPSLAPIILFVYNRPEHTRRTLRSLQTCELAADSELFIFSDAAKNADSEKAVAEVRKMIHSLKGFKQLSIQERATNLGLANSVIDGVSQVITHYGKAIVLEDDMIFANDFLVFLNEALVAYQSHPKIFSISGYSYPIRIPDNYTKDVYLLPRASSWGWATWANRWEKADWQMKDYSQFRKDGQLQNGFAQGGKDLVYMLIKQQKGMVNSWAVRWSYTHFKHHAYCLFPRISKLQNIGNDKSGTHSPKTSRFETEMDNSSLHLDANPEANPTIIQNLQRFFRPSIIRRVINYFLLN